MCGADIFLGLLAILFPPLPGTSSSPAARPPRILTRLPPACPLQSSDRELNTMLQYYMMRRNLYGQEVA